jgi:hypothetical protein
MSPAPAVKDDDWIDSAEELYLQRGDAVELDRPIFQGDVFLGVPLFRAPAAPPPPGRGEVTTRLHAVMVVPHPCQCYHGDQLRDFLTVAPLESVKDLSLFGPDHKRAIDKFPLIDLPIQKAADGAWEHRSMVAVFGRLQSIPHRWLTSGTRVACLSHPGLGLLGRRVLNFQMRYSLTLSNAMAFTQTEWEEAYVMQAWIRTHGSLAGYSDWAKEPRVIPGVNAGEPIAPVAVRATAREALIELITGHPTVEPV